MVVLSSKNFGIFIVDSSVAGTWYNELCSEIIIDELSEGPGRIRGCYKTAFGTFRRINFTPWWGRTTYRETIQRVRFLLQCSGTMNLAASIGIPPRPAWSGQRIKLNGEPTISTTWLLTTQKTSEDLWSATNIGTNVFTRKMPEKCVTPLPIHCCHPKEIHKQ